jgi:hypothetical protein
MERVNFQARLRRSGFDPTTIKVDFKVEVIPPMWGGYYLDNQERHFQAGWARPEMHDVITEVARTDRRLLSDYVGDLPGAYQFFTKGMQETARALWRVQGDPLKTFAVLFLAWACSAPDEEVIPFLGYRRQIGPKFDHIPRTPLNRKKFYEWEDSAREALKGDQPDWHHASRRNIPYVYTPYNERQLPATTIQGALEDIARRCRESLENYPLLVLLIDRTQPHPRIPGLYDHEKHP